MRIGILICNRSDDMRFASDALMTAGKRRGHDMTLLQEPWISIRDSGAGFELLHRDAPLPKLDVVLPRPNFVEEPSLHSVTYEALMLAGIPVVNATNRLASAKNKLLQKVLFAKAGLPTPHFAIVRVPISASEQARAIGFPVVLKVAFGSFGKGVFFAPNHETLRPLVDYLHIRDGNPLIIEEFVGEADRSDLRVFVAGGNVIAAMERRAQESDIRANIHSGGTGHATTLSKDEESLAVRAAEAMELEIAGVDIIRSSRGPLLLEVNANPGFEELSRVTGIDVADRIITYLETRNASYGKAD
jgi:ribosomal protein S6--L-glutamate ligase